MESPTREIREQVDHYPTVAQIEARLREASQAAREASEARYEAIVALALAAPKMKLEDIGRAAGLTRERVRMILHGEGVYCRSGGWELLSGDELRRALKRVPAWARKDVEIRAAERTGDH